MSLTHILPIVGAAVVVISYLVATHLPPPKPKIAGIDLGTTYSCIALYHAGSGEVEVVPDSVSKRLTIPSVAAIEAKNGTVLVGSEAKAQATLNPANTVYEAKRFIGRSFSVEHANEERFPFTIFNRSGSFGFRLPADQHHVLDSPEKVGAQILTRLKQSAEALLATKVTYVLLIATSSRCVMAVPAEFTEAQRNATKDAAALAGLEVLRLLTEPTAAAMAYGLHEQQALSRYNGTMQDSPELQQRLRVAAEELKVCLSDKLQCDVRVALDAGTSDAAFEASLTRSEFEAINAEIFERMRQPVLEALSKAGVPAQGIHEVVLVGGSTRVPKVRATLTEMFGKPPHTSIDPDQAVAVGVAVQAGILAGAWPLTVSAIEIPFSADLSADELAELADEEMYDELNPDTDQDL
ncbi:uncharacterized protein MONBRDRAFT_38951 [Monosiga brevicollis MX1]|uniref:Uncharacterized protein n=1 Tax=Monosiga brevicollis TaxID=81824 RepID=A9VB51_MONBE|nr:uncharacterized protein MONBRDRAFT_38951 [Monosiga brevicollis MX1]EDQ85278.1 predicted protein [Monosiga brevicollis MX1]|eukprot:XP_001749899.1 hypothetical protein [Monosiga brevicollis MX1]